jgi:hypothetical protein
MRKPLELGIDIEPFDYYAPWALSEVRQRAVTLYA